MKTTISDLYICFIASREKRVHFGKARTARIIKTLKKHGYGNLLKEQGIL